MQKNQLRQFWAKTAIYYKNYMKQINLLWTKKNIYVCVCVCVCVWNDITYITPLLKSKNRRYDKWTYYLSSNQQINNLSTVTNKVSQSQHFILRKNCNAYIRALHVSARNKAIYRRHVIRFCVQWSFMFEWLCLLHNELSSTQKSNYRLTNPYILCYYS